MIHFEIGKNLKNENQFVFSSESLLECLVEWGNKKYKEPKYFIDVWENDIPIKKIDIGIIGGNLL